MLPRDVREKYVNTEDDRLTESIFGATFWLEDVAPPEYLCGFYDILMKYNITGSMAWMVGSMSNAIYKPLSYVSKEERTEDDY